MKVLEYKDFQGFWFCGLAEITKHLYRNNFTKCLVTTIKNHKMNNEQFFTSFQNLVSELNDLKESQNKILVALQAQLTKSNSTTLFDDEWISIKDTCKILHCSEVTLWKLRKEKTIPFTRLNRTIRFKKTDVFKYLNQL